MAFSRQLEIKTVQEMIVMYCQAHHQTKNNELCTECQELFSYARQRIDKCFYGDDKPVCSKCPVHCYKPEKREKIKTVMQYSGPRMIKRRPILSLRYLYRKKFKSNV